MDKRDRRGVAAPSGRLSRTAHMAGLGAELAGRSLLKGAEALIRGQSLKPAGLLLTPGHMRRTAEELARLRGAAMKAGQLVSMDYGAVLAPELAEPLTRLQESAAPMPPHQLRRVLDRAWGPGWAARFERFETRPAAAASIGQVHRARLRGGRALAVKVQFPGVRDSIDVDLDTLSFLIRRSGLLPKGADIGPFLEGVRTRLHREADYLSEAQYLAAYAKALGDDRDFVTPGLETDLSGPDILAMDWLDGAPLKHAGSEDQARRNAIAERLVRLTLREIFEFGLIQSDPNPGNFRLCPDGRIALLDFGAVETVSPARAQGLRTLLRAGLEGDDAALETALEDAGAISAGLEPDVRARAVALARTGFAPLASTAVFDFAGSGLAERMRAEGQALQAAGFNHTPPVDFAYIQRKVAGIYLIAARLKARIALRPLVAAWL
ncbi:AarF/ABC1/UbiB kinase family protein [Alkalicaulis satelles]|uniref:AarF/ABC1/UbiB kinase family protein n=1 Tax=Alkalicaulis satelles TaxID=2609175 RepID=A0A5M6ZNU7_9PROT|nr:AarF/ABC1/UbiB kinase family protein [Alkalicaulis satelles]KAA5805387.1 AarF/ABC1/UbiB kinase family protein [Alkalicaulis satelles]